MSTVKYFSGTTELDSIWPLAKARFFAIGGIASKHNYCDSFSRYVGHPKTGPNATLPLTRRIVRKANPSNHKCDARCMNAKGMNCECSCGGSNHGIGSC